MSKKDILDTEVSPKAAVLTILSLILLLPVCGIVGRCSVTPQAQPALATGRVTTGAPEESNSDRRARLERERVEWRRRMRPVIRAGRLEELKRKTSGVLAAEVSALLRDGERKSFCLTYPYRHALEGRTDPVAVTAVASLKKREVAEIAKDREGVAKQICLCADGGTDAPIQSGRGRGACCFGPHGGRVGYVPTPTDQTDCRGHEDVVFP